MFQYLGAFRFGRSEPIDGKSPVVMLTNLVDPSAPGQETLEKFLGRELKTRYLNPKWVDAMVDEGYAGARFTIKWFLIFGAGRPHYRNRLAITTGIKSMILMSWINIDWI